MKTPFNLFWIILSNCENLLGVRDRKVVITGSFTITIHLELSRNAVQKTYIEMLKELNPEKFS